MWSNHRFLSKNRNEQLASRKFNSEQIARKAVASTVSERPSSAKNSDFNPISFIVERTGCMASAVTGKALTGGYMNQVFRVTGPFGDWVIKRFREDTGLALFPNLARAEARALEILGPLGIAPRLIDFIEHPDTGQVLIYTFHAGASWPGQAGEGSDACNLTNVASLLGRLHQLTVDGFRDVPVMPAAILAQGDPFLAFGDRAADLARLRPRVIDCPPLLRRSLLHTDTGPGNIIVGPQGLRLIDWQCPALGDPAEDLCAFLSPAFQILYDRVPLSKEQRSAFLTAYGDRRVVDRLLLLEPFFHWRMAAYCNMRMKQYAVVRPAAVTSYARALEALLQLLAR